MSEISVKRTASADSDFVALAGELSGFLAILNGENDAFYSHLNKSDGIPTVVVAYVDGQAVGCGAFRPVDAKSVEIKRMFVAPQLRGAGIGRAVLRELETWAAELGYSLAILETSKRLDVAVRMYLKSGFSIIPNYGAYVGVEDSVCMQKPLVSSC